MIIRPLSMTVKSTKADLRSMKEHLIIKAINKFLMFTFFVDIRQSHVKVSESLNNCVLLTK